MKPLFFQVARAREREMAVGRGWGVGGKRRRPFGPRWESFKVRGRKKEASWDSVCARICVLSFM